MKYTEFLDGKLQEVEKEIKDLTMGIYFMSMDRKNSEY